MTLQAFSRDPNDLFVHDDPYAHHQKKYCDVVFAIDVGQTIIKGTRMHTVTVDWYSGTITAYVDASDAMNNIPFFTGEIPPCPPKVAEHYVRETFRFLKRGHSMFHPECECRFCGYCAVGTTGQGRSVREIERELGVRSLYGLIEAGGELLPLMEVLVRLAGLRLHASTFLSSPLCCVPPEIKNAEHIIEAARALYPRALLCPETRFGDLARLNAKGVLRVLRIEATDQLAVFWSPPSVQQRPVDADIRNLWEAANLDTIKKNDFIKTDWLIGASKTEESSPARKQKLCCYHIVPDAPAAVIEQRKRKRVPLKLYGSRRR